jgi:hypothetical protein
MSTIAVAFDPWRGGFSVTFARRPVTRNVDVPGSTLMLRLDERDELVSIISFDRHHGGGLCLFGARPPRNGVAEAVPLSSNPSFCGFVEVHQDRRGIRLAFGSSNDTRVEKLTYRHPSPSWSVDFELVGERDVGGITVTGGTLPHFGELVVEAEDFK